MHRDKVTDKVVLPSAWEQLTPVRDRFKDFKASPDMFWKPAIVTFRCDDCGRERVVRV